MISDEVVSILEMSNKELKIARNRNESHNDEKRSSDFRLRISFNFFW